MRALFLVLLLAATSTLHAEDDYDVDPKLFSESASRAVEIVRGISDEDLGAPRTDLAREKPHIRLAWMEWYRENKAQILNRLQNPAIENRVRASIHEEKRRLKAEAQRQAAVYDSQIRTAESNAEIFEHSGRFWRDSWRTVADRRMDDARSYHRQAANLAREKEKMLERYEREIEALDFVSTWVGAQVFVGHASHDLLGGPKARAYFSKVIKSAATIKGGL